MEKINSSQGTLIGAQTTIKGNLQGDEDLNVVGRVDGTITLSKTLVVEPTGVVVADVKVLKAVISGTLVGNITADELVHITEEGRVVGDIAAPRVVLVEGASFRGNIDMGDLEAPPRAATAAAPVVRAKSGEARREAPKPAAPVRPAAPAPRPAPPPKRVVPVETKAAAKPAPKPGEGRREAPKVAPERKPEPERKADSLERRAEAAAQAVATRVPPPPRPVGGEPPRPPTTAGKKAKARRR